MAWHGICTFGWTSNGSQSIGGTLGMAWYGHSLILRLNPRGATRLAFNAANLHVKWGLGTVGNVKWGLGTVCNVKWGLGTVGNVTCAM